MVGTKLKTVFFATILAAILVIVITICIIFIPSQACIRIDPIEHLQTVQNDDRLQVTWVQPFGHGSCPMTYRIQLFNGTHLIWSDETVLPFFNFFNISFTPCLSNTISVYAVTYMRFENVTGSLNSFVHFGNIGPVTNLQVLQENNAIIASWDPPIESEFCSLSYEVTLKTHQEEIRAPNVTFDNAFTFEEIDSRPCMVTTVIITPLGEINAEESLRGQEEIHTHFGEVGSVEDLQLELQGTILLVSWSPPFDTEECQLVYQVTLIHQDELIQEYVTQVNYHNFEVPGQTSCSVSNISVTPIATVGYEEVRGLEVHQIHTNELGPIVGLELTQQVNGLFASWEAPDNSEYCVAIAYEVVLYASDGIIQESDVIYDNHFVFEQANLEPCTISIVSITPVEIVNNEITIRGDTYAYTYIADIGPVENLVVAQVEEILMVNWMPPVVNQNCPLTYEITLWHNEEVAKFTSTDQLEHIFEDVDVRPCVINEVSVIPIASKDLRESKGPEIRRRHFGEIGSVTDFEVTLNQDNLIVASWNAPIESELCELSYEILLESSEGEVFQVFNESPIEHVFSEVEPRLCVEYIVTITPIAILEGDHRRGLQDTLTHVEDIGAVEDLNINQSGESLLVTWARPVQSELCQMSYEVTLRFEGEILDYNRTDAKEYTFDQTTLKPCTEYHVSVIPTGHNQELTIQGTEISQRHFSAVGPVQNLTFQEESFGISWTEPINSDACVLTYHIQIETRDENVTWTEQFYPLDYIPCYYYIATVTPLFQEDQSGPSETETYDVPPITEIGPVQNLSIFENAFVWEPPVNVGVCNVTYELVVTINGEFTVFQTGDRIHEGLPPCSLARIDVTASAENLDPSHSVSLEVDVPLLSLDAVQNLEFLNDRVQWERPSSSGVCPIQYTLTHTSGSENYGITLPETHFLIDLKICSHHEVSVYPFYEGDNDENIIGNLTSAEIDLPNDATPIGQVQLIVDSATAVALVEWLPPEDIKTETCTVTYSIFLNRGFDYFFYEQNETYFQIPDVPCSYNELRLHAIVNGFSGEEATVTYNVASVNYIDEAPEIVNHSTAFNSVTTVWKVSAMEINACEVATFSVMIKHVDSGSNFQSFIPVIDNIDRLFTLESGGLLPDTSYTIRVAVFLNFPSSGPTSEPLLFRTDPAPPQINAEDEIGDYMKLTWNLPTHPSASGYEVIIHDNGPAHFLPSNCIEYNPEKNVHILNGNTTEFLLSSYLPSHNYMVSVTSLDASENYVFEEITPEARPGAPSLSREFLVGDDQNGVAVIISWPIPCNINGKLVKFSVEMEGFKEDVFAEDGRENYSVEIERLSEGSLYTVYVQTHLRAHHSDKSAITFKTPGGL